jgi:hypothetical protein
VAFAIFSLFFQFLRRSGQVTEPTATNLHANIRVTDQHSALSTGFGKQKPHNFYRNTISSQKSVCSFLANSKEQGRTAQISFLNCQEFPRHLWDQKFYYNVHCGSLFVRVLSHFCPLHSSLSPTDLFNLLAPEFYI